MLSNIKQMKCGSCVNDNHKVYKNEKNEILLECTKCTNLSLLSVTKPTININNYLGDGCITVF